MTSIVLTKLWLNRMDTGESVSANTGRGRTQAFSQNVAVRTYANGRRRSISSPGEIVEIPYTLVLLDLITITRLRSWVGLNVMARDHRGQKWIGVFAGIAVGEYQDASLYTATVTVQTTTTVEGE